MFTSTGYRLLVLECVGTIWQWKQAVETDSYLGTFLSLGACAIGTCGDVQSELMCRDVPEQHIQV